MLLNILFLRLGCSTSTPESKTAMTGTLLRISALVAESICSLKSFSASMKFVYLSYRNLCFGKIRRSFVVVEIVVV